jgi:hypothetical protein
VNSELSKVLTKEEGPNVCRDAPKMILILYKLATFDYLLGVFSSAIFFLQGSGLNFSYLLKA